MFDVELQRTEYNQSSSFGQVNVNIFGIKTDQYYEIYSLSAVVKISHGADGCALAIINDNNRVSAISEVLPRYVRGTIYYIGADTLKYIHHYVNVECDVAVMYTYY